MRICFVSYEIAPTTRGGCGTLISNVSRRLLDEGHEVVLLLDLPHSEFQQFDNIDRLTWSQAERCKCFRVDDLCGPDHLTPSDFDSIYAYKSYRFYVAARAIEETLEPDIIEFFDYCGPAYYSLSAKAGGAAFNNTLLQVRLHTTIELMDAREQSNVLDSAQASLYSLERAALRLAERVLYPSASYLHEGFAPYYEQWLGTLALSEPPLSGHLPPRTPAAIQTVVLFYGRLFGNKGIDTFVDAAIHLLRHSKDVFDGICFVIAGYDSMMPPTGTGSYRAYLEARIPVDVLAHFKFVGQIGTDQLIPLLEKTVCAVFPSHFESFCYAAHEIYEAGVPIIVSDIAAFRAFFCHEGNALVFDGTRSGLVNALQRLVADSALRQRLSNQPPVLSNKGTAPYGMVSHGSWSRRIATARETKMLLLVRTSSTQAELAAIAARWRARIPQLAVIFVAVGSSHPRTAWLFGASCGLYDEHGVCLSSTEIDTSDALCVVSETDYPVGDFFELAIDTLSMMSTIHYVAGWHEVRTSNGRTSIRADCPDRLSEAALVRGGCPWSRAVVRTSPGIPISDLFDQQVGEAAEIDLLWKAEDCGGIGITLPLVAVSVVETEKWIPSAKLISHLVARERNPWRQRRLLHSSIARLLDQSFVASQDSLQRNTSAAIVPAVDPVQACEQAGVHPSIARIVLTFGRVLSRAVVAVRPVRRALWRALRR